MRRSLHFHGGHYLNSFAKVNSPTPETLESLILAGTVLTCLWRKLFELIYKMKFPTPGPLKYLILAGTVLTFAWRKLFEIICKDELPYSGTIAIFDFS